MKDWWPRQASTLDDDIDWWVVPIFNIHVRQMHHLAECSWTEDIPVEEWRDCLWPMADNIQLDALMVRYADHIAPASLNSLLSVWWPLGHHGRRIGHDRLVRWFRAAGYVSPSYASGDKDLGYLASMPLTVYRGTDLNHPNAVRGISWTPDRKLAEEYARGLHLASTPPCGNPGWLWRATADPLDVLGRFMDPKHDEILIDSRNLRDVELVETFMGRESSTPARTDNTDRTESPVRVCTTNDTSSIPIGPQVTLQAAPAPITTPAIIVGSHPDLAAIDLTSFGGQPSPVVPVDARIRPELWPGMDELNGDAIDWEAVPVFEIHLQHMRHLVRWSWKGLVTIEDWRQCLLPMRDEMQIEALIVRYADQIAPASLNTLLPVCWTMCNHGQRQGYDRMIRWFRRAGYTSNAAMIGDRDIAQPPAKPLVLYRGTDSPLLDAGLGLSWTPDRNTAEDIASGFKESFVSEYDATPGWVWSATVDPENVLGWFREPGLDEILVDAKQLRDVEVREVARPGWPYNEADQFQQGKDGAK